MPKLLRKEAHEAASAQTIAELKPLRDAILARSKEKSNDDKKISIEVNCSSVTIKIKKDN